MKSDNVVRAVLLSLLSLSTATPVSENETVDSLTYEYVIVGSGPGGGTLAANLARAGHSVLLLEAGEDNGSNYLQRIPALANPSSEDPIMSWEFFVKHFEDQEQAQRDSKFTWRMTNGSFYVGTNPPAGVEPLGIFYPRTGTLGGCGNHNAMNLALPPDSDWDYVANVTGDQSWTASKMLQYFTRIENCQYLPKNTTGHGFDGWLGSNQNDITLLDPQIGFQDVLRSAAAATGDAGVNASTEEVFDIMRRDINRADPNRYQANGLYQITLHVNGTRERNSAQTYLDNTRNILNTNGTPLYPLTISTNSLATKIIFDEKFWNSTPKAIGIEYLYGQSVYKADPRNNGTQTGVPRCAYASKEVIIAGGAFNTPQILKLSGIGPREELELFEIPVIVDLPAVGTNLQDNYEAGMVVEASRPFENSFENCTFLAGSDDPCLAQWLDGGHGPYTQGAAPAGMLVKSSVSLDNDTDLFFFGSAAALFDGFYPGYSRAQFPLTTFFWSIVKMHPQNRAGTVKLLSADPRDVPDINFNFFKDGAAHDLQALREGIEFARRIFNETESEYGPFTNVQPPDGADIEESIMQEAYSHHAACSCPIGPAGNAGACVDSRFRVHGVENLRVVDASIFPRIPGAFPILPVFMISEKAFDVIMEDGKVL